ncbi:sulfotransferase family 2 domain-containing protein [Stappia stellulata]|uniref:sulfotransferase family 2 domain-containing protein n=1 Tax=Stappia stellulata TaxID=71235 RepID=UPI00041F3D12|nr:sulfotransferase family 2 domain-containing protein [Stappia stellulata]
MHDHHYLALSGTGLAYGRCPHSATDSIRQALRELSARHGPGPGVAPPLTTRYATGTLSNWTDGMALLSARQLERRHPDALVFAAIRDPVMRLAACYARDYGAGRAVPPSARFLGFREGMSFDAFTACVCGIPDRKSPNAFRSQADILFHKGKLLPRLLIRFEHREADWSALRALAQTARGIDIGPLPPHEDSAEQRIARIAATLDPSLRKKAEQRYRDDYSLFAREKPAG